MCVQFTILKEPPKKINFFWQTGRDVIQLVTEFIDTLTHLASVVNSQEKQKEGSPERTAFLCLSLGLYRLRRSLSDQ